VFASKRIETKKRDTLYSYFVNTLGYKDKLPAALRPYTQIVFMLGHQALFLTGIWWIFLPSAIQVVCAGVAMIIFFHNGGRFYVDHFWKAYERNTHLYVDAAVSAMSQTIDAPQAAGKSDDADEGPLSVAHSSESLAVEEGVANSPVALVLMQRLEALPAERLSSLTQEDLHKLLDEVARVNSKDPVADSDDTSSGKSPSG
ncbi:unnamed protein product, partial [Polarella glacialis]